MGTCRCRIPDWARFRRALGLSQAQLAHLLFLHASSYQRYERATHRCPSAPVLVVLRDYLDRPAYQARLRANNYPHPYPEDATVDFLRSVEVPVCNQDGLPLRNHPRCVGCGALVGDHHLTTHVDAAGHCASCALPIGRAFVPVSAVAAS